MREVVTSQFLCLIESPHKRTLMEIHLQYGSSSDIGHTLPCQLHGLFRGWRQHANPIFVWNAFKVLSTVAKAGCVLFGKNEISPFKVATWMILHLVAEQVVTCLNCSKTVYCQDTSIHASSDVTPQLQALLEFPSSQWQLGNQPRICSRYHRTSKQVYIFKKSRKFALLT